MREVPAVVEPHGEDGRPRFDQCLVGGEIGLAPAWGWTLAWSAPKRAVARERATSSISSMIWLPP